MTQLEDLLNEPKNGNYDFERIAKELMQKYCIEKRVDGKATQYYLTDLEFHYYGPGHEDKSVHPNFYTIPGQFRVHYSGVDITLGGDWGGQEETVREILKKNNKYSENKTLYYDQIEDEITDYKDSMKYGGILVRGIQEEGKDSSINGPWRVFCELYHLKGSSMELNIVEKEKAIEKIIFNNEPINRTISEKHGKRFKEENARFTAKIIE